MNSLFWERAHGGLTHLPIALIFAAAFFDALGILLPAISEAARVQGTWLLAGDFWRAWFLRRGVFGIGIKQMDDRRNRYGVTASSICLAGFHSDCRHGDMAVSCWPRSLASCVTLYLVTMLIGCSVMGAAGFFGGEMLLGH